MNGATRPIDAGALNTSLGELAATVQKYINITLGALAGILVIAILIVGVTSWFKAS